ncbi:uncharacterized protein LOC110981405 isoform X2 [Acanthaster planci]|uniref:TBC1 domain family member 15 n=1 Tax=Acanthaster planci TaxID=133434 RepID=A0A8B7YTF9_ACAPL|nr:uncharacterized protein LOC110981405 isoform X2 [Acanthaster planci]
MKTLPKSTDCFQNDNNPGKSQAWEQMDFRALAVKFLWKMEINLPSSASAGRFCESLESYNERSSDNEPIEVSISPRLLPLDEEFDCTHYDPSESDVVGSKRFHDGNQLVPSGTRAIHWDVRITHQESVITSQCVRTEKSVQWVQGVHQPGCEGSQLRKSFRWLDKLRKKSSRQLKITPVVLRVEDWEPGKAVVLELKTALWRGSQDPTFSNDVPSQDLKNILSKTEVSVNFRTELEIKLELHCHSSFQSVDRTELSTNDSAVDSKTGKVTKVYMTQLDLKVFRVPATINNKFPQVHFSSSVVGITSSAATLEDSPGNPKKFSLMSRNHTQRRRWEKPKPRMPKPLDMDEWDIIEAAEIDYHPNLGDSVDSPFSSTSSSVIPCRLAVVTFSPFTFAPRGAGHMSISMSTVVAVPLPHFAFVKNGQCHRAILEDEDNPPRSECRSNALPKSSTSLTKANCSKAHRAFVLDSPLGARNEVQIAGLENEKFFKDPYTVTMGGFSKVTNFFREALVAPAANRPIDEYAELMTDLPSILSVNSQAEQSYEMVVPESKLGSRPDVERRGPLTEAEWASHLDKEGRVTNVKDLQKKIFRGGLVPSLRKEVWKFLLKYYPWNSTSKERTALRKIKEDEYFCMKAQWKTITPQQEKRFSKYRDNKSIIEKDVIRTDRTHHFFEGEHNPHIEVLHDILMTYCQYNFDLGYVQGMSDLLAPILVVMEREVDAFWCLVGFLDDHSLVMNFDMEQEGMRNQLMQLNSLMQIVDPKLYSYLQSKECSNLYFCFRWLLIWFKREFPMEDVCAIWEVMWTGLPCKNFHLLMCLAILDGERDLLERENFDFSDILKHVNELSCHMDAGKILQTAEAIYLQLFEYPDLPPTLREVIGLATEENGTVENGSHGSESSIEVLADPSD